MKNNLKKEEIYLNLAECSEEEQREAIAMLPEAEYHGDYDVAIEFCYLIFDADLQKYWVTRKKWLDDKTEVNFQEFIKLFEGGEGETELEAWKSVANELVQALKGLYYMIGCDVKCGYNGTNYLAATDVLEKYKNINSK